MWMGKEDVMLPVFSHFLHVIFMKLWQLKYLERIEACMEELM